MAQAQTSGKSAKPAGAKPPKADKKARQVAAGTVEGKKAKPIEEQPAPDAQPEFQERREGDRRADQLAAGDRVMEMLAKPAEQPTVDMAAFQAEMAKLAEKFGVPAAAVQVKQKAVRASTKQQQNGVTRPAAETTCGKIWGLADAISQQTHTVATIAAIRAHETMKSVNDHTIKTQYARWRQYNNISGRLPRVHAVQQTEGEYAGLTPVVPPQVPAQ